MTIRFKFRSSVDFDSIEIGDCSCISVRDLRARIIEQKNLKISQDFDLVISDAESGSVYEDEDFLIPDGSSVIIRRVPAGRQTHMPGIDIIGNAATKQSEFTDTIVSSPSANVDMDNFDDFGVDLYPGLEASISDSDLDVGKANCIVDEKGDNVVPRCSEAPISRCQKVEASDLSEAISRGIVKNHGNEHSSIREDVLQSLLLPKMEEPKNLMEDTITPAMPNPDLPAELKCSLCNSIFKEAVMIPCCQHSFCDKCICEVLVEKGRCSKCLSTRCRVDDLLPNVSLRQAIEHFLESQVLMSGSDNILPKYAPDGESGIQVKELSCAVSIRQREPVLPHSPSTTGKGSNQVVAESACESRTKNTGAPAAPRLPNLKSMLDGLKSVNEFQGDGKPSKLSHAQCQKDEANKSKKGLWVSTAEGRGSFMPPTKSKRGDRNCYMCGSPDHLVRDCPAASSPYPMLQTGDAVFPASMSAYGPTYWQGASLPHVRPFTNIYGTPGMMPFDPTMLSVSPYAVPPYVPSMYAGLPVPCGFMRMGGLMPPMMTGAERPLSHAEFLEIQDSERRRKLLNELPQRGLANDGGDSSEGYGYNEVQRRSHDRRPHVSREITRSYSEDSENWGSRKQHPRSKHSDSLPHQRSSIQSDGEDISSVSRKRKGSHFSARDHKVSYSEKSNVELEDISDCSNRHNRERHKHRKSSKKHTERVGHSGNGSSRKSHHRSRKEISEKLVDLDIRKQSWKHHSHSDNGAELSSSSDRKRQRREESSHTSKLSRHKVKTPDDKLIDDRWEMVDGSDEDQSKDYNFHKQRRTH